MNDRRFTWYIEACKREHILCWAVTALCRFCIVASAVAVRYCIVCWVRNATRVLRPCPLCLTQIKPRTVSDGRTNRLHCTCENKVAYTNSPPPPGVELRLSSHPDRGLFTFYQMFNPLKTKHVCFI